MKILYVVPYVPNLIRVRPYNLIRHLARAGHAVTVATVLTDSAEHKDVQYLQSFCARVLTVQMTPRQSLVNSLFALPQRIPMQSQYSWHPELFKKIIEILKDQPAEEPFDVIHVEHLRGIEYGLQLLSWQQYQKGLEDIPIIWDSVDCISYLMRQSAQASSQLKNRIIASLEVRTTRDYESQGVGLFDRVLVTSPLDRVELIKTGQSFEDETKIEVLQNGVDLNYFTPADFERYPDTIVVTGKMSYHANEAMVKYLVNEIMPLVWEQKRGIRLQIVGKDPSRSIRAMGNHPKITVTGFVDDIRPYLQKATLAVVPITYGAGIQNKILEAMACATPVVVSARAAPALLAVPNRDYVVAESTRQFADAILDLLDHPQKRVKLGWAGREYVEDNHDWAKITSKLVDIYESTRQCRQAGVSVKPILNEMTDQVRGM